MKQPVRVPWLRGRGLLWGLTVWVLLVSLGLGGQQASANIVDPSAVTNKYTLPNPPSLPLARASIAQNAVLAAQGLSYSVNKAVDVLPSRTLWSIYGPGGGTARHADLPGLSPFVNSESQWYTTWLGTQVQIDAQIGVLAQKMGDPTHLGVPGVGGSANQVFVGIRDYLGGQSPYVGSLTTTWPASYYNLNNPYGDQIRNCLTDPFYSQHCLGDPNQGVNASSSMVFSDYAATINGAWAGYGVPALLLVHSTADGGRVADRLMLGLGYGTSGWQGQNRFFYALDPTGGNTTPHWYDWVPASSLYGSFQYTVCGMAPLALTLATSYTDMAMNHADWVYCEAASDPRQMTLQGYGDGSFRPTLTMTRAHVAVVAARGVAGGDANVPAGPSTPHYADVPIGHWAYKYIEYCYAHHIVVTSGSGPYYFNPEASCPRDQLAIFLARAANATRTGTSSSVWQGNWNGSPSTEGEGFFSTYTPPAQYFTDVAPSYYAYKYIQFLQQWVLAHSWSGLGYPNSTTFSPTATSVRSKLGEFAVKAWDLDAH